MPDERKPAVDPDDPLSGPLRAPSDSDFAVEVDGVGRFIFAKRKMKDHLRINVLYSMLTAGFGLPTPFLDTVATWLSTLRIMAVQLPDGFGPIAELDPLDDATYSKLQKVSEALRVTEQSFRQGAAAAGQAASA